MKGNYFVFSCRMRGLIAIVFGVIFLVSCHENANTRFKRGVLNLSFDDTSVCNWENYLPLFKEHKVKATFYICRPQDFSAKQWKALHHIEKAGHEIACHGLHHQNPFSTHLSASDYISKEMLTCKKILVESGFHVQTVGFPFGNALEEMERMALEHFTTIRRVTWDKEHKLLSQYDELFSSEKTRLQTAMGIDSICAISLISIESACKRAKENKEHFNLIAHEINTGKPYSISCAYLVKVLKLIEKYDLK